MELVVSEPAAARLAAVESLTLGAAGVAHRERGMEAFETMIGQSFAALARAEPASGRRPVRAIAVGIRGVVYRHLRAGKADELPGLVEMLVDWALGYQQPESETVKRAAPRRPRAATRGGGGYRYPARLERAARQQTKPRRALPARADRPRASDGWWSRRALRRSASRRSRPRRAPRTRRSTNTSQANATPFSPPSTSPPPRGSTSVTPGLRVGGRRARRRSAPALRAMLEHIAGNELFARITFFDLQTAGPVALDRADAVMDTFTAFLQPGVAPAGVGTGAAADRAGNRQRQLVGDPARAGAWEDRVAAGAGTGVDAPRSDAFRAGLAGSISVAALKVARFCVKLRTRWRREHRIRFSRGCPAAAAESGASGPNSISVAGSKGRWSRRSGDTATPRRPSASWSPSPASRRATFYDHFESKQECFLATFDTIVAQARRMVGTAYREPQSARRAAGESDGPLRRCRRRRNAAASLVIVDSLSLGTGGARPSRARRGGFRADVPPELRQRAGGDRALRPGREVDRRRYPHGSSTAACAPATPSTFDEHCEELLAWAQCYQLEPGGPPGRVVERRTRDGDAEGSTRREIRWEESPSSRVCRARLTQRERIVRAAAQIAAEIGYATLTIPAISARAGTSNQTFYEHFESKDEAFIAAFEELSGRARRAITATSAGQPDWRTRSKRGPAGLLEHLAAEPIFARLAFIELPMVGTSGLDQADAATSRFTAFLAAGGAAPGHRPVPPMVIEAIGGGIWGAIQHEIGDRQSRGAPGPGRRASRR